MSRWPLNLFLSRPQFPVNACACISGFAMNQERRFIFSPVTGFKGSQGGLRWSEGKNTFGKVSRVRVYTHPDSLCGVEQMGTGKIQTQELSLLHILTLFFHFFLQRKPVLCQFLIPASSPSSSVGYHCRGESIRHGTASLILGLLQTV